MKQDAATGESADPLVSAILEAVLDIVAQEGFEGATVRRVAARAGCSTGALQKRFATRTQLVHSAYEFMVTSAVQRIEATETHAADSLLQHQRSAAFETLPLDLVRRRETLVWTAFLLRAATDDTLGNLPRELDHVVQAALELELREAQTSGALRSTEDVKAIAAALVALVDGIAVRMLYTPQQEHPALLAALDVGLRALLPS